MTVINTFDPTASVAATAANQTVVLAPGFQRVMMSTTFAGTSIINFGILIGPNNGVDFSATASGQFTNKTGGLVSSDLAAVRVAAQCDIINDGTLLSSMSHGIAFQGISNNSSVINRGTIYGAFGGITAQAPSAMNLSITNSGEIRSDNNGLWLTNAPGAAPVVTNTGTIIGRVTSILAENGDRLNVTNSGKLIGNVVGKSMGQPDKVVNSGTITGDVLLGPGNDVYSGNGSVSGTIYGEAGADLLSGGQASDRLSGGDDADTLTGNSGNDVLKGDAGADKINGGLGKDMLSGGTGIDMFRYTSKAHSVVGANADRITDFDDGNAGDRINVSALFPEAMTYRHNLAFTAAGQVRINDVAGADVIVEVNTGGTLAADFSIRLVGTTLASMNGGDFIL